MQLKISEKLQVSSLLKENTEKKICVDGLMIKMNMSSTFFVILWQLFNQLPSKLLLILDLGKQTLSRAKQEQTPPKTNC